jgi:hypothetical protein
LGKHRHKVEQLLNQEAETELRGAFTRELSTVPDVQLSEATRQFFTDPFQQLMQGAKVDTRAKTLRFLRDDGSKPTDEDIVFGEIEWREI